MSLFGGQVRYRQPPQRTQQPPQRPQPTSHRHDDDHHHQHSDHEQGNQRAETLIRAMINAAKSDGAIDQVEQDKIVGQLGEISREEADFLRNEFRRPLDVHEFAHSVPTGLEDEVYAISLMAIDLDTRPEAEYLRELAKFLRISPEVCNDLHDRYGAPRLYR
ncbi:MAG: DUF533 domain-containing protein [Pirellulales bacterium]